MDVIFSYPFLTVDYACLWAGLAQSEPLYAAHETQASKGFQARSDTGRVPASWSLIRCQLKRCMVDAAEGPVLVLYNRYSGGVLRFARMYDGLRCFLAMEVG